MVYLQQDAFDPVDASASLERQKLAFERLYKTIQRDYAFEDKAQARDFFTRLTGLFKNFNHAAEGSTEYSHLQAEIDGMVEKQFKV